MPARSLDSALPTYMLRAQGIDISWMDDARCRRRPRGMVNNGWLTREGDRRASGSTDRIWIDRQIALVQCQLCPVQWQCTRFAIETEDRWHVAGLEVMDRSALAKYLPWKELLGKWEKERISVQDGTRVALRQALLERVDA